MTFSQAGVHRERLAVTPDGRPVERFTLHDGSGTEVRVLGYGGVIQAVRVPDRDGTVADVALGYDTLDGYLADTGYQGALIGRYANRIARGRFTLEGQSYTLATNDGPNHLHGGPGGFHTVLWDVEPFQDQRGVGVVLTHESPAGTEGYPGTLRVRVTYTLAGAGELAIDYHATTSEPTPVSLTQHTYFNLAGHGARDVLDHELQLHASHFTPVDGTLIPTGEIRPVAGTPFDFTTPARIGARIDQADEQLRRAGGYDHNFILGEAAPGGPRPAARLHEPVSGRVLEVLTTEPGIQFYSGNFLSGEAGKDGRRYAHRHVLALETQHFPDSPNQPAFPSTILRPGEEYTSRTVYRFSVA